MSKDLKFTKDAREKIFAGVDKLTKAVECTLGPKGRNVAIQGPQRYALVTKDGVTVAQHVQLADPFEDLGARIALNAALKTAETAGDGTTTSTVLMHEMLDIGRDLLEDGHSPVLLKRGMDEACAEVIEYLDSVAVPCESFKAVEQVGTLSANGDRSIGTALAQAMARSGSAGVITVDDGADLKDSLEFVEGMEFPRGYLSPYFVNNKEQMAAELKDPYILLIDKHVSTIKQLIPVLEQLMKTGRPMLIVAESVKDEALANLIVNVLNGKISAVAVRAPGRTGEAKDVLTDIAVLAGGLVISEELGRNLESVKLDSLGIADRVIVTAESTTIINGHGDLEMISGRIAQLTANIENSKSEYEKLNLRDRIARLSGGVAVIKVGAATEVELKERKARMEDALYATRAAVEAGVVPGSGIAFLRAWKEAKEVLRGDSVSYGKDIVYESLKAPFTQILLNGGQEPDIENTWLAIKDLDKSVSYNMEHSAFNNMFINGVLDPVKVTKNALINAVSAAGMLLTTDCAIVDMTNEEPK